MKALVYTGPNQVRYRDEPDPQPADGEVLIRIEAAGICGSDMHAYHGHDPRRVPPMILGHELAGRILAGPGAGRRVTVNLLIDVATGVSRGVSRNVLTGVKIGVAVCKVVLARVGVATSASSPVISTSVARVGDATGAI